MGNGRSAQSDRGLCQVPRMPPDGENALEEFADKIRSVRASLGE
jgi:hypothetical protein